MSLQANRFNQSFNSILSLQGLTLEAAIQEVEECRCLYCGGRDGETLNLSYWYYDSRINSAGRVEAFREWRELYHEVGRLMTTETGELICSSCGNANNYSWCQECGELSNYSNMPACERHYENLVEDCRCGVPHLRSWHCEEEHCPQNPNYREEDWHVPNIRYIQSYSTRINNLIGQPADSIYLGVELEILSIAEEAIYYYSQDRAILKSDSSIYGIGFEIVTAPMSLEYQLEYWEELIAQFSKELTPDDSCGMHVHISREPLSQLQIGKILVFLNNSENSNWIDKVAGRQPNNYCQRKEKTLEDVNNQSSRYEALNLLNNATLEFRLFASSNKIEEIARRIEFCHALTKYCENAELDELEWDYFMKWLYIDSPKDLYLYLKEWVEITEE